MKLSLKRLFSTLLVGVLLAAPVAGPFQLDVNAASDEGVTLGDGGRTEDRTGSRAGGEPIWKQLRDEMDGTVSTAKPSGTPKTSTRTTPAVSNDFAASTKVSAKTLQDQIKAYAAKEKNVIGWLRVPGTNINEPIVLDNDEVFDYYEKRTWDGTNYPDNNWTNYRITATFADFRTKIGSSWKNTSRNIVLYGHNWTNIRNPLDIGNDPSHVMFGQLPSYTNADFAKTNPYIYFSTEGNEGIWKVFSVFYCEQSSAFPFNNPNPSDADYKTLLGEFKNRSIYDFSTEVSTSDHIITLNTCTRVYGDHGAQSFNVMARLLREGESDTDPVTVSVNADMKKPLL